MNRHFTIQLEPHSPSVVLILETLRVYDDAYKSFLAWLTARTNINLADLRKKKVDTIIVSERQIYAWYDWWKK